MTNLFSPIVPVNRFHPQFRALLNSPYHAEARLLINTLYQRMGPPSKSFIRKFQTDGFHSHLFEISCFAYLENAGLCPERNHQSPDFMASRDGIQLAVEVTTSNPPGEQAADISLRGMENLSEKEIEEKAVVEFPRRMMSILKKKLGLQYDKLPHCMGKPLILMVAPFFEPASVYYTDESLIDCLYGIHQSPGFFGLPNAESVSAVLYCNAFTVPRFFRLSMPLDNTMPLTVLREGMYYAVHSETELSVSKYQYRVGSPTAPKETWSQGVTLFLNPYAENPVPTELMPCTSSFSVQDGYLVREVTGFHPMTSFMHMYPNQ